MDTRTVEHFINPATFCVTGYRKYGYVSQENTELLWLLQQAPYMKVSGGAVEILENEKKCRNDEHFHNSCPEKKKILTCSPLR